MWLLSTLFLAGLLIGLLGGWTLATRSGIVATEPSEPRWEATRDHLSSLNESFNNLGHEIQRMEQNRSYNDGELQGILQALAQSQRRLDRETGRLTRALATPASAGQWGELSLRRVLELSGMAERVDFVEQAKLDAGGRPDVVVHLPNGRCLAVDAKAPVQRGLSKESGPTDARWARDLRRHVENLSKRAYWLELEGSVDFVVLYLPTEALYSRALDSRPGLIEEAARSRIIIASPATLIALLRTVACGWAETEASSQARRIVASARELTSAVNRFLEDFRQVGSRLRQTNDAYRGAVDQLERSVLEQVGELGRIAPVPIGGCQSSDKSQPAKRPASKGV